MRGQLLAHCRLQLVAHERAALGEVRVDLAVVQAGVHETHLLPPVIQSGLVDVVVGKRVVDVLRSNVREARTRDKASVLPS